MKKQIIKTAEDVFRFFDADFDDRDTLEQKNERLSRRVYKNTSCGAWAKVEQQAMLQKQKWIGHYKRGKKTWKLVGVRQEGKTWMPLAKAPKPVQEFFWPWSKESLSDFTTRELDSIFGGKKEVKEAASIPVPKNHRWVFYCGSIVEGVDQYVDAAPVTLPCTGEDLDKAVKFVEGEADRIWNNTHGCEGCAKKWSKDMGYKIEYVHGETAIHEKCPKCKGWGASI